MVFNSVDFLIFFPVVVLIYYIIPEKIRMWWLLICSYYFYMCWNAKYILLLLFSTSITYIGGRVIDKIETNMVEEKKRVIWKKCSLAIAIILNLGMLGVFKYFDFFIENMQKILRIVNIELQIPKSDLLLPVGISFFTFQAIGYVVDVYRGTVKVEKNFFRYALFVSFFPQLVAGPIERTGNLMKQFYETHPFDFDKVKKGLLLMGWGFFLKMVIADRIAIFVDTVYTHYPIYNGWFIVLATILFAFQIYCDFAGYTTIAIGAANVMGFQLMENFKTPYCASSVKDFWARWHISLTSWFRDYLYIPLGGNRKGKIRKYINQVIVFMVSGLWHGAMWSYVVWGGLNGLFLVIGDITRPMRDKVKDKIHWNRAAASNKVLSAVLTFVLVDFTWIFFRSSGMAEAKLVIQNMFAVNNFDILFDGSLYDAGLDQRNFWLMILSIVLLMIVDVCHNKGMRIREWIARQNLWFRWLLYICLVESILIFGVWGAGYNKAAFIYFQF